MAISWKKLAPLGIYIGVAMCLSVAAASSKAYPLSMLSLFLLGFLCWGLGEYFLHRFVFHHEMFAQSPRGYLRIMHLSHHDDPLSMDHLFVNFWTSAPVAVGFCMLTWATLGDWRSMAYVFAGVVCGYCSYEWLHYQAHHGRSGLRLFRYLKRYHLLHHGETPNRRFGVTSPLFDYLFGTFQPVTSRAPRPAGRG